MASSITTTTITEKVEPSRLSSPPPPPPPRATWACIGCDLVLRILLLAALIVAVVVTVTSKETEEVFSTTAFLVPESLSLEWTDSPAFIYFVVALSVAGLYAIITILASLCLICRKATQAKLFLILAVHDALILGIVASATGAAGGVAYIALRGNSKAEWGEVCGVYGKYCRYVGSSIVLALIASILLVVLVILNITSLYLRTPRS
ncbi:hypothetical protein Nepgr_030279 [Nepenthes gracilis]|uniref:CASP-like protein n=1 Tax=Nepenthes gracilis TaxID=150966 RepID=A0AAD3TFX9_NEPGR|nr:hypothetical protein Nepgr_030279 [Nepenthes gracilis]